MRRYVRPILSRDDWYRNIEWDDEIEKAFDAKLARARRKPEYLRVQAGCLAHTHPDVALRLVERYFETGETNTAPAHLTQAVAWTELGDINNALSAYDACLAREAARPNSRTTAAIDYPFLVASLGLVDRYEHALNMIASDSGFAAFPIQRFKVDAAVALISADLGATQQAREHAIRALDYAAADSSGHRYHADIGLVGGRYPALQERLLQLAKA